MNMTTPYVGMPASYRLGSDIYAGQIIEIVLNKHGFACKIVWKSNNSWKESEIFTLRKDGRFLIKGCNFGVLQIGDNAETKLSRGF